MNGKKMWWILCNFLGWNDENEFNELSKTKSIPRGLTECVVHVFVGNYDLSFYLVYFST